jgi:L-asparagine permease
MAVPPTASREERTAWLEAQDEGYKKALKPRQLQMIAIGGAIGTGLFLGTAGRLEKAGPALALVYLVCGLFCFFILRALGELVMHRPSSGSFASYAREFLGERGSFVAGWMYYLNWAMTGIVDITAAALYLKYWNVFAAVPQWVSALIAMLVIGAINLSAVGLFGEMEFWFALVKVAALALFLVVGVVVLISGHHVAGHTTGLHLVAENGGMFPQASFRQWSLCKALCLPMRESSSSVSQRVKRRM